jgi:hypothetical protein
MFTWKMFSAVTLGLLLQVSGYAQSAQLKIDSSVHDFGKVTRSQILQHRFALQNAGTSSLYIRGTTTD